MPKKVQSISEQSPGISIIFAWIKICLVENITPTRPAARIDIKWDNFIYALLGGSKANNIKNAPITIKIMR